MDAFYLQSLRVLIGEQYPIISFMIETAINRHLKGATFTRVPLEPGRINAMTGSFDLAVLCMGQRRALAAQAILQFRKAFPATVVLVLSLPANTAFDQLFHMNQIDRLLDQHCGEAQLIEAIKTVLGGKPYSNGENIILDLHAQNPFLRLTTRELIVSQMLLEGWTRQKIAHQLGLTLSLVNSLKSKIFKRLRISADNGFFELARNFKMIDELG